MARPLARFGTPPRLGVLAALCLSAPVMLASCGRGDSGASQPPAQPACGSQATSAPASKTEAAAASVEPPAEPEDSAPASDPAKVAELAAVLEPFGNGQGELMDRIGTAIEDSEFREARRIANTRSIMKDLAMIAAAVSLTEGEPEGLSSADAECIAEALSQLDARLLGERGKGHLDTELSGADVSQTVRKNLADMTQETWQELLAILRKDLSGAVYRELKAALDEHGVAKSVLTSPG